MHINAVPQETLLQEVMISTAAPPPHTHALQAPQHITCHTDGGCRQGVMTQTMQQAAV
jgi:hypothetical protein